jgi:DNA-binding transcriptional LysR family regulator
VPSLLHLPLVLPGTQLVATMPERIVQMLRPPLEIKTFPLPFATPPSHEILLWHKRHDSDPAHTWLRNLIIQLANEI